MVYWAKMAEMANNRQIFNKNSNEILQRGPFESGDFGENGRNGEQSPNYMKEDHRSNGRNFCSCEKKA